MRRTGPTLLLAFLALWTTLPLVVLALRAHSRGEWFSGADAPTMFDQLQYFGWIRDAAHHVLVSNLFRIGPSAHVFVDPVFLVSAGLARLGLSVQLSYLAWAPVAAVGIWAGPVAWARRRLGSGTSAAAAVAVGLFYIGPIYLILHWLGVLSNGGGATLSGAATPLFPAALLLGGLPFAVAVALVPVVFVLVETERYAAAAAVALVVAWIHPWQGEQLVLVFAGLFALGTRDWRVLAPALAAAIPIVYFALLAHLDTDWRIAHTQAHGAHVVVWALLVTLGPLAVVAAFGVRAPRAGAGDTMLVLWPIACLVAFAVTPSVRAHALVGITLPLAVLATRAWLRFGWPPIAGLLAAATISVAAAVYLGQSLHDTVTAGVQPYTLPRADRDALAFLDRTPQRGGVLARVYVGALVPGLTGRQTWVGHASWSPDFLARAALAEKLFKGSARPSRARYFVRATGARFVFADCAAKRSVDRLLAPIVAAEYRFGCARVFVLR